MGTLTSQTLKSMVSSKNLLHLLLIGLVCTGVVGSSSGRGGVRSQKSEDAAIAGSHQSSFYTYEDYGSTGLDRSDYVDYEYGEEGEADRQDLGLVGIFGLGGIGLATMGTIFASAMFGALMAPVVSGAFSSLSEQISDSEFELPELPFRALRHAVIDDRRSFTESPILSWIDTAESLYSTLGGKTQ